MSFEILETRSADFEDRFSAFLQRFETEDEKIEQIVDNLLKEIKRDGVYALLAHVQKFDRWKPASFTELKIHPKECKRAYEKLEQKSKEALHLAYERIYDFHSKQKEKTWLHIEENGSILGQKLTPLNRAGLYIPGGKAAYPSSLLMNAIPAIVAGVKEIVVCTPTPNNEVNSLLLAALHLCNIDEVYKVGGASAIGMLAYGLKAQDFEKVDVITGPGNIYVANAKKLVFGQVSIDMVAGPSEITIIAQKGANSRYIAYDLLSQAEHDELACPIMLSDDMELIKNVIAEVKSIIPILNRTYIAESSMQNRAIFIHTRDIQESIKLSNIIAPEHLELMCRDAFNLLPLIKNAGAIFLGENSSEPMGDYIAGPNHTLPTSRSARFFSPLGVEHFMKKSSIISCSFELVNTIGEACAHLASLEGLQAHELAILERLKK